MAAANGHLDIVEYLISQGVDINAFNEEKNTPLHWACLNGHTEAVKKLILAGASLGILNRYEVQTCSLEFVLCFSLVYAK
ncbi:ANKYRIN REPEAT FAMILY PROTEIN [Salix purpurea]|uniref:ANKYRIN REPEAT FAMILY PROTEIN n=1 Tax=Salix purpurea TaxID=77065 RepID=A0A9Q0PPZ2_SALPP|nr:ANKYRIN REPEAT FAMILY PROTEIN [Salix purpurea]